MVRVKETREQRAETRNQKPETRTSRGRDLCEREIGNGTVPVQLIVPAFTTYEYSALGKVIFPPAKLAPVIHVIQVIEVI